MSYVILLLSIPLTLGMESYGIDDCGKKQIRNMTMGSEYKCCSIPLQNNNSFLMGYGYSVYGNWQDNVEYMLTTTSYTNSWGDKLDIARFESSICKITRDWDNDYTTKCDGAACTLLGWCHVPMGSLIEHKISDVCFQMRCNNAPNTTLIPRGNCEPEFEFMVYNQKSSAANFGNPMMFFINIMMMIMVGPGL